MEYKVDKDIYNTSMYKTKFDISTSEEVSFFDTLNAGIKTTIASNRQITINNLNEVKNNLASIRDKASQLTDSIINHADYMIVEKEKLIKAALKKIHENNQDILNFEAEHLNEHLFSVATLYDELLNNNFDYYKTYKLFYSNTIENLELTNSYLKDSSEKINYVIDKHFQDISREFLLLDSKISEIDDSIKTLINTKNFKEEILDEFFNIEVKRLIENQINFCINEDPFSEDIHRITENKNNQYTQYKKFVFDQEDRLEEQLSKELDDAYSKYYHRKYIGNENELKAQKYADRKIKPMINDQKHILFEFKKDNLTELMRIKHSLDLYMNLYKTDPFLAQILSDEGSKIITQEVDFTRLYKMNKSLKYHLYFTYKLSQLNNEIHKYEYDFVHYIENKFKEQEIDTVNIIKDIKLTLIDQNLNVETTQLVLNREKEHIVFLGELTDIRIKHLIDKNNLSRSFLYRFTALINSEIYKSVESNVAILSSSSDIRLALKESEIETLHFKHMFENEKRLLLIQQNRLESETKINFELISSTYLNQMRFAKEQIIFAEEEMKLRLSALIHNVDSERIHFYDMITHEVKLKEKEAFSGFSKYQKHIFDTIEEIENTADQKLKSSLENNLLVIKRAYRKEINEITHRYRNNIKIQLYQKRLEELDMYLEDGYLSINEIYETTIKEMDEIYRYAEFKYNELLESVDSEKYPLDTFLLESFKEMKKRFLEKMKYAEITLEEKITVPLEEYRKLYFQQENQVNSKEIFNLLDTYQKDLKQLKNDYYQNVKLINQDNYLRTESYNTKSRIVINHYDDLNQSTIKEKNDMIKQINSDIRHNDKVYNDFLSKYNHKHKQDSENIVKNYLLEIQANKKLKTGLNEDYTTLLNDCSPYIAYSNKTKNIKKIIHKTLKMNKQEERSSIKTLKLDIKKTNLI